MEMLKYLLFAYFCGLSLNALVHAQAQSGFISIDCGIAENTSYTDKTTGLYYISDSSFIETGVSKSISLQYNSDTREQQFWNVRSFPDGIKNCYTLKPAQGRGNRYLIRASFMYGNYDSKDTIPAFDLYLGANKWDSVKLDNASSITVMEIMHIPSSNYVFVCLLNTGYGTPFISALELRHLTNNTYRTPSESLVLYRRLDMGTITNKSIRYKDDAFDRIWRPYHFLFGETLSTLLAIDSGAQNIYQLPSVVMQTAATPKNASSNLEFYMRPSNPTAQYYVYMHFAEVEKLEANQSREFNIYQNDEYWNGPITLDYLHSTTIFSTSPVSGDRIDYSIRKTETSTHPPILSALEVYIVHDLSESQTDDQDVDLIINVKKKYGVKRNWQGDPCAPKAYIWEGLNCSYGQESHDPVRIISLNLSSGGLTGDIASYISDLTMIESLDLSNNSLTGSVPDFLSKLQYLKFLDLSANNLTGSIPIELLERSTSGSLQLSVSGNPELCSSSSCKNNKNKNNKFVVPLIASMATLFVLLIALAILWTLKRRKGVGVNTNKTKGIRKFGSLQLANHQFTYSEILDMTNNFERVIGRGGFGTVYHGYLNNIQVAVKMLSESSSQGYKEFQAEVKLLMRVHHRNLTSLVGYCKEDSYLGLIYEYMANGNLQRHLSDKNAYTLSWEDRMRIAVDAAQGLEYLHNGCKPPIIHRDIKTTNILLNEKLQAKLADFGLSRAFSFESGTHLSTAVAGTLGYLDPEYYMSNWLHEKSDVYSFGVALLEIITSRPVLVQTDDKPHISQWVSFMVETGEIKNIIDPRLRDNFNISSAWKAVEIASACVRRKSIERPTMNQVVMELKECLALEIAPRKDGHDTNNSIMNLNVDTHLTPFAR
nr:probable LRR receptor-like serine/threonine-protein kinase At1g05700 [Ziziphus jujuba var. spinosa]